MPHPGLGGSELAHWRRRGRGKGGGANGGGINEAEFVWTHKAPLRGMLPLLVNYNSTHCQCKDELGSLWVWNITFSFKNFSRYLTMSFSNSTPIKGHCKIPIFTSIPWDLGDLNPSTHSFVHSFGKHLQSFPPAGIVPCTDMLNYLPKMRTTLATWAEP